MSDPYLIPGTDVLRNKLGIFDADVLDLVIDDLAIVEATYLFDHGPSVRVTLSGWQNVHKAMFEQVFDWAGELRTIHIRKVDEHGRPSGFFAKPERFETDCGHATRHLEATLRRAATDDIGRVSDNLAEVYASLNLLHPFREGNGRSQKVFLSAVCKPAKIGLAWDAIPSQEHNVAAARAMAGDPSLLKQHFRAIVYKTQQPSLALRRK